MVNDKRHMIHDMINEDNLENYDVLKIEDMVLNKDNLKDGDDLKMKIILTVKRSSKMETCNIE